MRVLGIDVGPTSIGGALIDLDRKAIDCDFVRVFPEGVDRDQQGGEQSKNQTRRISRGMRRQIRRRSRRKRLVREALQSADLLPSNSTELKALLAEDANNGPYRLRADALAKKLSTYQLGRVFFHLATRRGFLSNRKDKPSDLKGMLAEMGELQDALTKRGEVLGQYLHYLEDQFDHTTSRDQDRVRHRHTRRAMYETEFDGIWEKQRGFYPDLLTEKLKYGSEGQQGFPAKPSIRERGRTLLDQFGIYGMIFYQRKMYWPRSVIGRCDLTDELVPSRRCKSKRCPKADRAAQEFRILQEVNNLKVLDRGGDQRSLNEAERRTIVDALMDTKQQTFEALRKKLGFTDDMTFNIERGGRDKLKGHETDSAMSSSKGVGKRWRKLPEEDKDRVIEVCIHETQEDVAIKKLTEDCCLTAEEAQRAVNVNLPDGYMSFCRAAIERLNPHLRRGLLLMADDASNSAMHAAGYLRPDQRVINVQEYLPQAPDLPNPIVRQAMVEVRKVVNAVIQEYGTPDRIHIELAREAKKSAEERQQIRFDNAKRERRRAEIAERVVDEYGLRPTRANINRYLLWEEQGGDCIYCGEKISQAQLFSVSGDASVDHILPRWRSLDDSMSNKVVCHRWCNEEKKDRTAREWLESSDRPRYEQMLQLARRLDYGKRQKLQQLGIELSDFVERQLRDTTYIARCVKEYLECLGVPVVCPRGGMTKDLRHWWGLNNILDKEKKGRKNRADHRHHAVDAIVIALTDHARLHALANARGENMPLPWAGFLNDARMAVLNINVSHRTQRKISGALHEETLYGPTQKGDSQTNAARPWARNWVEDPNIFVRRKDVTEIKNAKHLEKVRDPVIRETLAEHLRNQGIEPYGKKAFPTDAFKGDNRPHMKSGVPIKKVRMLEESETFRQVSDRRSTQFVKPGNNHHIIYWAQGDGASEKWSADVITMWDAAKRARAGLPPIDRTPPKGKRFVMSLSTGEMFEMVDEDGEVVLCVVRKMDQRSKRVYYKLHTDARETDLINKDNLYMSPKKMQEVGAKKVTVDPLGRIRWAND